MKKILNLSLTVLCLFLALSLASCGLFEGFSGDGDRDLQERIAELEAELDELETKYEALEDENEALEAELAELKGSTDGEGDTEECVHLWEGDGDIEYVWAEDLSSCLAIFYCAYCEQTVEESSYEVDVYDDGSAEAFFDALPSAVYEAEANDTDTEYHTVTNADELLSALATYDYIRLGADIESESGFDVIREVTVDLAGYELKVLNNNHPTFWVYSDMTVADSVGGSKLYQEIVLYDIRLTLSGDVSIEQTVHHINGDGFVDLSGYAGEELHIYSEYLTDIILPDGYAFYETSLETRIESCKAEGVYDVLVRPITPEVATAEELALALAEGGRIILTEDITVDQQTLTVDKDLILNLAGRTLTFSEDSLLIVKSDSALIINGEIVNLGLNAAVTSYAKNLLIDRCFLTSESYYAVYCCDGMTEVRNTVINGGICAMNCYTDTASVDFTYSNLIENIDPLYRIDILHNGSITFDFDPTELLGVYNEGSVTDNGDGTYTLAVAAE